MERMAPTRAAAQAGCGGCDRRVPPPVPLPRLTKYQYRNSLRDLLGQGALDAAASALASLPDDKVAEGFDSMNGAVQSAHVVAYYAAGDAVGAYFAARADRRGALSPCLGGAAPHRESCVGPFVLSLGSRAYRRPLSDEETADLMALYDAGGGSAEGVVRGEPVDGEPGLYTLTPFSGPPRRGPSIFPERRGGSSPTPAPERTAPTSIASGSTSIGYRPSSRAPISWRGCRRADSPGRCRRRPWPSSTT